MVYDEPEDTNDNVLVYIYKLREHLYKLQLLWQGLHEDSKNKLTRISSPVAPDDFIYLQISSLQTVLSPHNFVSQIEKREKNNILLDTFSAFLKSILKEQFFNWDKFSMVVESYYNTLHLFLNSLEGGFGAQFTLGAQTGITRPIHKNEEQKEIKPYADIPEMFGFNKNKNTSKIQQPNIPNNGYDNDYEQ